MKQSWRPQYRSNLFSNPVLWIVCGIVLAIFLFGFFLATRDTKVWLILAGYSFCCYAMWEEAKRWQTYGYQKITIDSDNYKIIFDNELEIPFAAISDVCLESEPVPPKSWWLRSKHDLQDRLREFNGFIVFRLYTGEVVNFSVQNKIDANGILRALKKCNINVNMSDVTECELNGTYQLVWLIFVVVIAIILLLCKVL